MGEAEDWWGEGFGREVYLRGSLGMTGRAILIDGGGSLKKCPELFSHFRLLTGKQAQACREQSGGQANDPRVLLQGLTQLAISEP
jgi:hypothetical protein